MRDPQLTEIPTELMQTRADGQSRSDLIELAKSLTEEHFVVLGVVAMLIAFGCSGVLLSDAGVKPNEEDYGV